MCAIKFDGFGKGFGKEAVSFTELEKQQIREAVEDAMACSASAVMAADQKFTGKAFDLACEWFGGANHRIAAGLKKMHSIFIDSRRTLTFVDGRNRVAKTIGKVGTVSCAGGRETDDILGVVKEEAIGSTEYAHVKCVGGGGCEATAAHVGSGMRIFLGPAMFNESGNRESRAQTVYHELTHKVLDTGDPAYGKEDCRSLAKDYFTEARKCADNWGYFVTSFTDGFTK